MHPFQTDSSLDFLGSLGSVGSMGSMGSRQNGLLARLAGEEYSRLLPALELHELTSGQSLCEAGDIIGCVYFPLNCTLATLAVDATGASIALAITGNEGLVGVPLVLGGESSPHRIVVQSAGSAYRLRAEVMRWELDQARELQRLALRFAQAVMVQMAQALLCSHHHSVQQQLGRWLLHCIDCQPDHQINLTQETIAHLLGVRREAIAEAAGKLQQAGLIRYSRGRITVIDRSKLDAHGCDCYRVVRAEYERLLTATSPATRGELRSAPPATTLRKRAEASLRHTPADIPSAPPEVTRMVQELHLRRVELELQNEELEQSFAVIDEQKSRYADLYDFAPVGFCTVDALGAIQQTNLAAAILLGIKRSESRRHRFGDAVVAGSQDQFAAFLRGVFDGNKAQTAEITLNPTDQRPAAIVSIKGIPDESGQECRMVVIDITEQRLAENRLKESEAFTMAVLNSLSAHVAVLDADGQVLAVNDAWCRFAAENGSPGLATFSPGQSYRNACLSANGACSEEADAAWTGIAQVLEGARNDFHLEYPCDSPTQQRWFRMSVFPLRGGVRGAVVAHENITAQKMAELALRQRDHYQRALLDSFPFLVWLKDKQSRFLAVNAPFAANFGWPSTDSLIGKSDYDITAPELAESYRIDDLSVLESGASKLVEELIEIDGHAQWLETYKSPVTLDGQTIGTVGYARNISSRHAPPQSPPTVGPTPDPKPADQQPDPKQSD